MPLPDVPQTAGCFKSKMTATMSGILPTLLILAFRMPLRPHVTFLNSCLRRPLGFWAVGENDVSSPTYFNETIPLGLEFGSLDSNTVAVDEHS